MEMGLVKKEKSLDKKNLVRVRLTPKGEKIYAEGIGMESIHAIMSALTAQDRACLKGVLEKLRGSVQAKLGRKYTLPYEALGS